MGAASPDLPAVRRIVTGGQTGVDRAATDVAVAFGIPTGGWVPRGGWAEDHPEPPGVLADYPGFVPTDSADPIVRTTRNVEDADATLVLVLGAGPSPGTAATEAHARARASVCAVVDLDAPDADAALAAFIDELPRACVLNVAGPRESEQPGVYAAARGALERHAARLFGASRDASPSS